MSKIILTLYVITATSALVFLKLGTASGLPVTISAGKLQLNVNAYVIAGFLIYGVSFLTYMYLISKNDLGYIIPVAAAFVYILLFISSYFVFKESFSALKIAGILFIITGIVCMGLSNKS